MKYLAVFSLFIFLGAGCFGAAPASENGQEPTDSKETQEETERENEIQATVDELKTTWQQFQDVAADRDCETFNTMLTERIQLTAEECEVAFDAFAEGVPELQWNLTEVNDEGEKSRVFISTDRALSTFFKNAEGAWQADTKFWPEE